MARALAGTFWFPLLFLIFGFFTLISAQAYGGGSTAKCKCVTPSCYPAASVWSDFNATVGGRLILPRPTAYPCYKATLDANSCSAVKAGQNDGFFRAAQPGSMQTWNLEEAAGNNKCPLETADTGTCQQGRVPNFGVAVTTVADIQKTLKFASDNNLRLFVKNTAHDYLGRSVATGAFMLWMHDFNKANAIVVNKAFVVAGCSPAAAPIPAITLSGGPQWRDVYAAVSQAFNDQMVVVAGMCPSVGGAGGFIQGGGHSPLGPTYGLSADHVVQMEIVTADGVLHVVNQCQEPEYFWALRGGGGGTFGVLTSVTYQLQPAPAALTSFQIIVSPAPVGRILNNTEVQTIATIFSQQGSSIDAARWAGYFEINARVGLSATMLIPLTVAEANNTILPFIDAFRQLELFGEATFSPTIRIQSHPSFLEWRTTHVWPTTNYDAVGARLIQGNRIIPIQALQDPVTMGKTITDVLTHVDTMVAFITNGRGVREQTNDLAVNPAWRQAAYEMLLINVWDFNTSDSDIEIKKSKLVSGLDVLRAALPGAASYFGEAYLEPEDSFKQTFWGSNYDRLLKFKKLVDPKSLFVCRQCVASDEWDIDGNCKKSSSYMG